MESAVSSLVSLGQYGVIGVMIALIILCAGTIYALWKMACNHIQHTNDIFLKNTEALTKLIDSQDKNSATLERLINKL